MINRKIVLIFCFLFLAGSWVFADNTKGYLVGEGYSEEEIKYLEEAFKLDPDNIGAYYALAVAYYRKGDYEMVIEQHKNFVKGIRGRDYAEAAADLEMAYNIINTAQNNRHYSGAFISSSMDMNKIEFLVNALKINPRVADAYIQLAGLKAANPQAVDKAIEYFQNALKLNPANIGTYYALAAAYYKRGEYEKALECLLKYTQLNPECVLSHYGLGIAYSAIQDTQRVEEQIDYLRNMGRNDFANELKQATGIKEKRDSIGDLANKVREMGGGDLANRIESVIIAGY